MNKQEHIKAHIEVLAGETIATFEQVSSAAQARLRSPIPSAAGAFASVNTMTSAAAIQQFDSINYEARRAYETLTREPAIARVVVKDELGSERTYYVCRSAPLSEFPQCASYRAPIGRLASLDIGDELRTPGKKLFTVVDKAVLRPSKDDGGWDSYKTIVTTEAFGPVTIESLRAILATSTDIPQDLLEQLLGDENLKANVIEGIRRTVITKMELRDQPILDQFQDEIFRLSLDQRLLILGPPGTGKTTTLIRRLGQKLDLDHLDSDEREVALAVSTSTGTAHQKSWLMFTPTELLKQYLKEAFAREDVPASDQRITTWQHYRHDLARNVFGILRTPAGTGTFIAKSVTSTITPDAINESIAWFNEYDAWQRQAYFNQLRAAAEILKSSDIKGSSALGSKLLSAINGSGDDALGSRFEVLSAYIEDAKNLASQLKAITDAAFKAELNRRVYEDRAFIDALAEFVSSLRTDPVPDDDVEDIEADDDDSAAKAGTPKLIAVAAYYSAMRAYARSSFSKKSLKKGTAAARIVEWLGTRIPALVELRDLGESLMLQSHCRRFVAPLKRYIDGLPRRYRVFRRQQRTSGSRWYSNSGFSPGEAHVLEIDLMLLAALRVGRELLSRSSIARSLDEAAWAPLKMFLEIHKAQVLVDEATDFSPVQLACMFAIAHPKSQSFFACGDFNQRLTAWGTRTPEEFNTVIPDLSMRRVSITYRQSRQLCELAQAILRVTGGNAQESALPPGVDSEGVAPAVMEFSEKPAEWVGARVQEIERFVGQLPSVAVFVGSEEDVVPFSTLLAAVLSQQNIPVVPCQNGQVVGQNNEVRVFDIQHIKGLEFEAVFFVGLDRVMKEDDDLFPRYLYVGATRAATYLGVTTEAALPAALEPIRSMFTADWAGVDK